VVFHVSDHSVSNCDHFSFVDQLDIVSFEKGIGRSRIISHDSLDNGHPAFLDGYVFDGDHFYEYVVSVLALLQFLNLCENWLGKLDLPLLTHI
jgi:hypothetical protein